MMRVRRATHSGQQDGLPWASACKGVEAAATDSDVEGREDVVEEQ
jgi:hypothetical protein